jgi:hypothetical protein
MKILCQTPFKGVYCTLYSLVYTSVKGSFVGTHAVQRLEFQRTIPQQTQVHLRLS